ncbi:RluA family pseudouridine synthase [Thalassobacillus devorans]|uniref:RluA family pseudouridine synthase n=1 Tax=Thalassobacillus devorans TaxID=279813 RepID=UPI00048E7A21|nr:RluA family pseudouridine synthase [Thalassobacillus devorans]
MKHWSWTWKITKQHEGMLVREYLIAVRAFSRQLLKQIKQGQGLKLNGIAVTVRKKLAAGDELEVILPAVEPAKRLEAVEMELSIVYEDEDVLVIDKPAGLAIMPSMNHDITLANGIIAYYQQNGIPSTIHVVTRLDRDTSGLVLIAKHAYSHSLLAAPHPSSLKKTYLALVDGHLGQSKGTIEAPIGRKDGSIIEREVREDGQAATTRYEVLESFERHSLVQVELVTGRTHQIRVHMSYLGHPLAGDDLYGGSLYLMKRQALHCHRLAFTQPLTRETVVCQKELPRDMFSAMNKA